MTNNLLMVMHAREIPECMKAFKSLDIDVMWLRGFHEKELQRVVPRVVAGTHYENYIIGSDDLVPTQAGLDAVEDGLDRHEVFTGWCNMFPGSERANTMLRMPLLYPWLWRLGQVTGVGLLGVLDKFVKVGADFALIEELRAKEGDFRVSFAGFAFTGMRRELWQKFPFECRRSWRYPGGLGSDWILTKRLLKADIPIMTSAKAEFYHLASRANMIVGKKPGLVYSFAKVKELAA